MRRKQLAILVLILLAPALWYGFRFDPNPEFQHAIKGADRIVIRNGGFNCCGNDVDAQSILLEITDKEEIDEFNRSMKFQHRFMISFETPCRCCGFPGIDWYRGTERIALTGMQHGRAVRWAGFRADESLTLEAAQWFESFRRENGLPKERSQAH